MRKSHGFTLIEMLATVTIIGIIAAIAIPSYGGYMKKTRIASGQSALLAISQNMARWYAQKGTYQGAVVNKSDDFYDYDFESAPDANDKYSIRAKPTAKNMAKDYLFLDQNGNTKKCSVNSSNDAGCQKI